MKNIIYIITFIGSMIMLESCSLSARLNYHMNKVDKILKKEPNLSTAFDTSLLIRKDTAVIRIILDTSFVEVMDTISFDDMVNDLLSLRKHIDSLYKVPDLSENQMFILRNKMNNQKDIIDKLRKGAYKDTIYKFNIKNLISNRDTAYYEIFTLELKRHNGILSLKTPSIKTTIQTTDTQVNINYDKQFTFWQWLDDERTLFLILLLIILIGSALLYRSLKRLIP